MRRVALLFAALCCRLCAQKGADDGAAAWQRLQDQAALWVQQHPKLVSRAELGRSVQERPLFALRIGRQDDGSPEVYLGAAIHGGERSEEDLVFLVETLLARREEPAVAALLASRVLWVQPAVNPDGLVARRRQNARGVDLNRNFSARWQPPTRKAGSHHPGPEPFSEPESQAVRDLLQSRKGLRASLDLHRSTRLLVMPSSGETGLVDDRVQHVVDAVMAQIDARSAGWGRAMPVAMAQGITIDWIWDALGVVAFTMENDGGAAATADQDPRWIVLTHLLAHADELPRRHAEPTMNGPVLVTASTRKDPAELARLQDPGKVLFRDGFESDASFGDWFELFGDREHIAISHGNAHGGNGALQLTTVDRNGEACGVGIRRWLGNEGFDRVHLRWWIRYAADYDQGNLNHTGAAICGVAGNDKWRGMGTAGRRPAGDDHWSTRLEGWRDWQRIAAPGFLHSYTYWMDMARDRDGNFWGNMLMPVAAERFVPPRDRWLCCEQRVQMNTPDKADGELAVWLDGRLYTHWRGIRWRSSAELRAKRISLDVYVHQSRQQNRVWFDDVVVSTGYVGTGN